MRFTHQTVVVTGGGSGIGRVMAKQFAAEGASVVIADRDGSRGEQVAHEITVAGGRALAKQTDVSIASSVDNMVTMVEQELGSVDVLVNNAGACLGDDLLRIDEETWDADMDVGVKSVFLCSKRVLPGMIRRRTGNIVNIASVNGLTYLGNEAYSAAKAAMINLTQSLAVRFGKYGIRANAIAAGTIRTPIWQERVNKDQEVYNRLKKWYPLGRLGEPEDIAAAALFLASEQAAWITGVVLRVDGGLLAGNEMMKREIDPTNEEM